MAAYVADIATSEEATTVTTHDVQLPNDIVSGDIIFCFVMLDGNVSWQAAPSGWNKGPELSGGTTGHGTMYWTFATDSSLAGTTVQFTSSSADESAHVTFCVRDGDPWTIGYSSYTTGGVLGPHDPAAAWSLGYPSEDVLVIATHGGVGAVLGSFPTNYNDNQTEIDAGAGICSQAACTRTLNGTGDDPGVFAGGNGHARCFTIVVRPRPEIARVGVHFLSGDVDSSTTGPVTPSIPVFCADDDIALCVIENQGTSLSPVSGWAHIGDSPQNAGSDTTRLSIWWKRVANTEAGTTITLPTGGNHRIARMLALMGCVDSGDPWDVTAGSTDESSDTSGSVPGDTTTVDGCMVIAAGSSSFDIASAEFSGWTNADLAAVDEILDNMTTQGNGGGFGVAAGGKVSAGSFTTTDFTLVNASVKAMIMGAFKPRPMPNVPQSPQPIRDIMWWRT